ncbi:MAG: hypothetical protein ACR2PO_00755 [Methyloligellaceae bacterium]
MDRASLIFCVASLGTCLVVSAAAFPYAAKSRAEIDAARTVTSAEQFEDVDLGAFGTVSVLDLVTHYMENPPEPPAAGAAPAKKVRFQGC